MAEVAAHLTDEVKLLERLARLVPPPRIHRHRYHGVLAPNACLRSTVVTIGRPVSDHLPVGVEPPRLTRSHVTLRGCAKPL